MSAPALAPVLDTARLSLRQPVTEDTDAIIAIAGDWEVARRLARMPHPYAAADARFFLDHIVTTEPTWAMVLKPTGALVGIVGLAPLANGLAEFGYYVSRPDWGRGYAGEAAAAVVEHGFRAMALPAIASGFFADNPASGRVLEKLGFQVVGTGERFCLATRAIGASVDVELTRERWRRASARTDGAP